MPGLKLVLFPSVLKEDGTVVCPACDGVFRPNETENIGEEGGYFESFEVGDRLICSCGAQLEVSKRES